jgi:hypothetical protein
MLALPILLLVQTTMVTMHSMSLKFIKLDMMEITIQVG